VDLDAGADRLLVRREGARRDDRASAAGGHGFLASLATASSMGAASKPARTPTPHSTVAPALRARIADGTIVGVM
jgi:hypothetical protein